MLTKNLDKIKLISNSISSLPVSFADTPAPLNLIEEKEKFLASTTYNPIFAYRDWKKDKNTFVKIDKVKEFVKDQNLEQDIIEYFMNLLDHYEFRNELRKSFGSNSFYENSKRVYDWDLSVIIDFKDLDEVVKFSNSQNVEPLDAKSIFEIFQKVIFEIYKLTDWVIQFVEKRNAISVRPKSNKVIIGEQSVRTRQEVERLIVHEIETHVLRSANTQKQDLYFLKKGFVKDKTLFEEGLAVYNEFCTKTLTRQTLDKYIFRLNLCKFLDLSFRDLYELVLENNFNSNDAFEMVYRFKRGMGDTSKPGGNIKDSAYLIGYSKIDEFIKSGGSYKFLYAGKFSTNEIILDKYDLIDYTNIILPDWAGSIY